MVEVKAGSLNKRITIPPSKSYANRLLILGALVPETLEIKNLPKCQDVQDMSSSLNRLGIKVSNGKVLGHFPPGRNEEVIESGDGGTTNRFLMALAALDDKKYTFRPSKNFLKRPIKSYLSCLKDLGAKITKSEETITISGPISFHENMPFEDLESSQFISALKLAFFQKDLEYGHDYKYLLMTDELIRRVRNGEREFKLPADFSSMSYPLALAAVDGDVTIENGFPCDTYQADSLFIDILKRVGAFVKTDQNELNVAAGDFLTSFSVDAKRSPDLMPTLAFLASRCEGVSKLENLSVLQSKESNRFEEIIRLLTLFEVDYRVEKDSLIISGDRKRVDFKEYESPNDHRMAMAAYLFMKNNSGGKISNSECVDKSFPEFFDLLG